MGGCRVGRALLSFISYFIFGIAILLWSNILMAAKGATKVQFAENISGAMSLSSSKDGGWWFWRLCFSRTEFGVEVGALLPRFIFS